MILTISKDSTIDLQNKKVAVIGSGASSIQVVPTIQPACQTLDVFVRSPTYILPTVGFGVESSNYNETCVSHRATVQIIPISFSPSNAVGL